MTSFFIYAYKGGELFPKSKFNQIDFPDLGPCVDSSSCYAAPPVALLLFSSSEPEKSMKCLKTQGGIFFKRSFEESTRHKALAIRKCFA